jgi:hypothetical protein
MRTLLVIAVTLAACGSEPSAPAPDAAPEAALPDAPPDVAPDAEPDAPAPPPDAGPDTGPDVTMDAAPDAPSAPDVAPDAAVDADPRDTAACRAVNATCDGRRVNIQTGERDGGITYHCGGCGIACPERYGCLACVCIPL